MVAHQLRAGWNRGEPRASVDFSCHNSVGTTGQAQDVTQAVAVAAARSTSWIGAEFFYTSEDTSDADNFGLLNADGSAKPAWTALAAALAS